MTLTILSKSKKMVSAQFLVVPPQSRSGVRGRNLDSRYPWAGLGGTGQNRAGEARGEWNHLPRVREDHSTHPGPSPPKKRQSRPDFGGGTQVGSDRIQEGSFLPPQEKF